MGSPHSYELVDLLNTIKIEKLYSFGNYINEEKAILKFIAEKNGLNK
jgi:hypothetical protein